MTYKRVTLTVITAMLILCLVGCSTAQVVTDLQIALDAITVALPVLGGLSGLPADVLAAVTTYLTATNQALGQASTILDGPGSVDEKFAAVGALFAGIAAPIVPPQYAALAQLVQTIATDVGRFLGAASGMKLGLVTAPAPRLTKLSIDDRLKLAHAHAVATDNAVKLAKMARK